MIETLYLVRHGETEWNLKGMIQGRTDVPLSDSGRQQVRTLTPALAGSGATAIWTSPLQRARETATIIASYAHMPMTELPELAEIDCGAWEGKTVKEIVASDPARYDAWLTDPAAPTPGGESFADVATRIGGVLERMQGEPDGSRLIIVSHAATIRALAAALLELPVLSVLRFVLEPASVSVISRWVERDTYRLERWNARMW